MTTFLSALEGDLKGSLDSLDKALGGNTTQPTSLWSPVHFDALTDPSRTDECLLVEKRTPDSLARCKTMVVEIPMPPYDLDNISSGTWEKGDFPERLLVWGFELSCRSHLECAQNIRQARPDLFDGIYLYDGVDPYGAVIYVKNVPDKNVLLEDGSRIKNLYLICSIPDAGGVSRQQLPWAAILPNESSLGNFGRKPYPFAYINAADMPVPPQSTAGVGSPVDALQDASQMSRLMYSRTRWHLVPPGEATQAIRFFPALVKVKPI
ncbi:conserved hypothetical protein [Neospora caninum Liverpool]|nr:conserved hypothetical protein [Neospora caninum Liverpool]CBZ51849.1 conserved hypothetical protein [Neospora caninum Liverpool]|eukprot:XP_003881882.1 conserved hypothetical protein [Neospora caninum Liverpool]